MTEKDEAKVEGIEEQLILIYGLLNGWGRGAFFAQTLNIFLYIDVCIH